MGTFVTHPYLPYHASMFLPKFSYLTDPQGISFFGLASSAPASSYRCFRYILPIKSVPVSPWRASCAGNLDEKMTQQRPNLSKRERIVVESRGHDATTSTSISKTEWAGRKFGKREDAVNGKTEDNEGREYRFAKASKNDARSKQKDRYSFRSLPSKKGSTDRGAETKNLVPDDVRKKRQAGEPGKQMASTSIKKGKRRNRMKYTDLSPEFQLRIQLDTCSKKGDVVGAISIYDSAVKQGIRLQQHHYNVLLYLCSSAALGVVHPGKSGSGKGASSTSSFSDFYDFSDSATEYEQDSPGEQHSDESGALLSETESENKESKIIRVSEDVKNQALAKGLEIYERMCSQTISMSEAALTSVARMAMATGNGDLAFDIVKKIKDLGLTVRLRSYAPALFSYCNDGEIIKAFEVEKHMLDSGVQPEEPELAALLKISIEANKSDKVYYLLQKLRASVRQVSPSTAELIEKWFRSPTASKVGRKKWNSQHVTQAMENGGGGWHGLGWLGKGKWLVTRGNVDGDGVCLSCGEKLVAIDIDPVETENFAESVASIAEKRDKNFLKFQKWLDHYGPFEAVIDGANVGVYSQRHFSTMKVNEVADGVRQKLPSKKWPLIVLHNRRIYGGKMDSPVNNRLVEKWKNADALYATPTGSNDDWYWLYAAVKCKSLIVTNDEMRDHNFQVLGNDFFPKWKERHQVRFTYKDGSFEFYMPPACSTVIQESEKGDWHVPISSEQDFGTKRTWLCIRRNEVGSPYHSPVSEPMKGS